MIRVIKDGNPDKAGNAVCPQCGKRVLVPTNRYGAPSKCSDCNKPYKFSRPKVRFIG